jgi:hypothetical protein
MGDEQLRLGEHQKLRIVSSTPDREVTVELGRDPARTLVAGDTLDVPRGTPHRMWNAGPGTARALWHVMPAMRTKEMFEYMDQGRSPARAVGMLWRFRNEYRLRVF